MLEVAYILVALALIVFLVYLIITVQKLGRVIDETEKTIKTLTSEWINRCHLDIDIICQDIDLSQQFIGVMQGQIHI